MKYLWEYKYKINNTYKKIRIQELFWKIAINLF